MGTTLTGKRVQNTYDSLLKLSDNDNLTGTPKIVGSGLGTDSPIYLSTTKVGVGMSPSVQFQTSGDAQIGNNLVVGGNLTVNGTTTYIDSTIVEIGDNMIELAKDNTANIKDIGWYGTINDGSEKFVGVFYDASTGTSTPTFKIGLGTAEPSSTAAWTVKGKLVIGQIDSTGGTFSGQITIPQTPTADGHAASKKYVDDQIGGADKARRVTITVKNTETVALSAGTVVHAEPTASPPSGNIVQVKKADYDTASLMPAIGILNEDLDAAGGTNDEGEAIMFGFINGIDTSGFSAGDELYVGNDGALTNSKPLLTTQLIQKIAVVMKVDSTNGSIEVFGAGRSNDVPNEVDRDLSIAGTLKVDDELQVEADSGYGRLEVGGPDGGYIDLKTPFGDDYDLRIITNSSGSEFTGSGDFNINAGNTLTLTLDGTDQSATFAGNVNISKSVGDAVLTIEADTDNNNENDNPRIELKQDAGAIYQHLGINGDTDATFTGAIANYGYLKSTLGLQVVTGATSLALTISNSQNVTFAGKLILPSSHTKQKIEVYGGGNEWIGTSTGTLELSGAAINLNGAAGTGASILKNAGTSILDNNNNLYANSFRPIGNTNGLEIYGYGGTNIMIQGVSGATYYYASGTSTLCSTHQSGQIILASGLAYGAVNNYTQIIDGSTGAITGTSATFSGDITPTTDSTSDLGSTSLRWANVWTDNINGGTPVNTANDLVFDRASTRKIIFNSDTNFGSDKAFLYFNENSSFHRTGTENVRFSIGAFNDFSNSTAHSDAVDVQGGSRLYLNAGDWDTELDSAIGTPATGAYLDSYPIQFAINNDQKIRIGSGGDLNVKSATYSNYLNIGTYTSNHINSSTLPDVPSEHLINIAPPSTTNYYGGGISWSEGTNTAASLGVFDDGGTGALGFYVATGNNSGLTKAFEIDSSQNAEIFGPLRITTSNLDGVIEGYDSNHAIVLRENNSNVSSYYQYGGTLAEGRGHKFYTGGTKANQTLKFHIADDGIESSLSVLPSADSSYDLGSTSKYWRNLYVDNIYSDGGNSNALKVYRGTATISNTAYTTIATVNGDNLASAIRLAVTGTSGNVVINVVAEILVNHSTDILIKAQSGYYTRLKIKIVSDNNEDFAIELQRVDTTGNTTVAFEITPLGNEAITLTSSHSISGSTLEHVCERGESRSSNDTAGYKYDSRFEDGAKIRLGDSSDLELYHDGSNSYIREGGTGDLLVRGNNLKLQTYGGADYLTASTGAQVELYYNNSKKFETTSNGAVVSDYLGVKDVVAVGDNDYNGGVFARVGNTSYDGNWGFNIQRTSGVDDYNVRMQFYPNAGTTRKLGLYNARGNNWILYADGSVTSNCDVKIPNGNLMIGSTSAPNHRLDVNGNINIPGGNKIVFNNEPNAWFLQARTSTSTPLMSTNLKNLLYCGGGASEGFSVGGTGTGDPSFEVSNNGYSKIKEALGITMNPLTDGGELYINNGQTALNQGHPATSGSTQNAITRVFAGYGTYGEVLDTGFNVSSTPYAWIQATNHTALNVNYNLILNPNGGSVGIGTGQTAPAEKLTVDGNILANVSNNGTIKAQYDSNNFSQLQANSSGGVFTADSAGTTKILLRSYGDAYFNGGNVGIGLTTGINQKLTVNGNISVPNGNSIYFAGPVDANWRIGRNIHPYTTQIVSGNSLDIVAHHSSNQGFTIGPTGQVASLEIKHGTGVAHHIVFAGNVGVNEANILSNRKFRSGGGYSLEGGGYNTSYTSDGLFGPTATPNILQFSSGRRVLLGYSDNGSGLYAETMAIETHSTDGLGNTVEKNGFLIKNINSGSWVFQVTNLGQVTCDSRVRIATTRTDEALNINGNIKGVNSSAGYTHFFHNDPYHGMTLRGYPTNNSNYAMTAADVMSFMEYGGDFRFYKKNASVLTLQGRLENGNWTVTGDVVAYGSPSDIRLKENIKPIENALDKVDKLQGVTFDWKKSDSILKIKEDYGFIAQDVEKVLPELVRTKEDGMKSLRHQGITPILLEAIKELKAEIQELKSEIKELKK